MWISDICPISNGWITSESESDNNIGLDQPISSIFFFRKVLQQYWFYWQFYTNWTKTVLSVWYNFCKRLLTVKTECKTKDYLRLVAEVSAELTNILENSHIMFSTVTPELGGWKLLLQDTGCTCNTTNSNVIKFTFKEYSSLFSILLSVDTLETEMQTLCL